MANILQDSGSSWPMTTARVECGLLSGRDLKNEIHGMFRDLEVVDSVPSWMTGDQLAITERCMTFDIDDVKPDDWITRLLRSS
jgi:hypothetical protein